MRAALTAAARTRTLAFAISLSLAVVVAALTTSPASASGLAWSEASWRADLARAAADARASHPKAVERLEHLDGLNPEVYLARRRPEPEVARELSRLVARDEIPAALLAELSLGLDDGSARYPFSAPERFQKRSPDEVARLVALEREQLRAGLLLALGESRHPSAFYVARGALLEEGRALEERRVAAVALGTTRDARAVPVLAEVARAEKSTVELKAAALAGLAHVRSLDATRALERIARESTEPTLQRAVALSLGNIASASALRSRKAAEADEMRQLASTALVDLLTRADDERVTDAVVDALGMVAHPLAAERVRTLTKDERVPTALRERALRAERRLERVLARQGR